PLYFQQVRGEDALMTGLLMAPQGVGVALAMPLSGRLADRVGGGIVAVGGIVGTVLATLPLTLIGRPTPYATISAVLLLRGVAMGFAIMPAMSAAYVGLRREQIRDASPQLNVVQRVGGSLGTALFAVLLERLLHTSAHTPA